MNTDQKMTDKTVFFETFATMRNRVTTLVFIGDFAGCQCVTRKMFAAMRNSVRFFADCAAKKGPLPGQLEKRA